MSSVVAIVKSIVGQVFVISPEGVRRVLVEGDRLFAGDQVDTGLSGAVSLELADGRTLDLGRETQWSADTPDSSLDLAQATAQAAPSVAELQQAIAAGADPSGGLCQRGLVRSCRFNIGRALGGCRLLKSEAQRALSSPHFSSLLLLGQVGQRDNARKNPLQVDPRPPATSTCRRLRVRPQALSVVQGETVPQSAHLQCPESGRVTGVVQAGNWSLKDMHLGLGLFTLALAIVSLPDLAQ